MTQSRVVGDVSYILQSDVDEAASIVMNTTVSCSTAEGEVPQRMTVIESQGGGVVGETTVRSGQRVEITSSISGADATAGITGT